MKVVQSTRESSWLPLRLTVPVIAGLLWLAEFAVVAIVVRTGLQVGVVISALSMMWLWLSRTRVRRAGEDNGSPKSDRRTLAASLQ
jgi:hypothetical protein